MGEDARELPFKERKALLEKNRAAIPAGKDRTVHRRRSPAVQRRMQARPRGHSSEKDGKTPTARKRLGSRFSIRRILRKKVGESYSRNERDRRKCAEMAEH